MPLEETAQEREPSIYKRMRLPAGAVAPLRPWLGDSVEWLSPHLGLTLPAATREYVGVFTQADFLTLASQILTRRRQI